MRDVNDRLSALADQLEVPWALLEYHAATLTEADLFWSPSAHRWTMHRTAAGWVPDLAEVEPDPVPVPTVAWLTWHIGWWMSAATGQLTGEPAPAPDEVGWPGDPTRIVEWLRQHYTDWRAALGEQEDPERVISFPWPRESGKTVGDLAGWVTVELTKNVAELGQLMILRRSGVPAHSAHSGPTGPTPPTGPTAARGPTDR